MSEFNIGDTVFDAIVGVGVVVFVKDEEPSIAVDFAPKTDRATTKLLHNLGNCGAPELPGDTGYWFDSGDLKLVKSAPKVSDKCTWKQWGYDQTDTWDTSCGETFAVTEGTPTENKFIYCPYCGKEIVEAPWKPEEADRE